METEPRESYNQGSVTSEPQAAQSGGGPDWNQHPDAAYLAYILKEVERIGARTDRVARNTMIIMALLAIGIIVMIIVWLDLIGALPFF